MAQQLYGEGSPLLRTREAAASRRVGSTLLLLGASCYVAWLRFGGFASAPAPGAALASAASARDADEAAYCDAWGCVDLRGTARGRY